MLWPPFTRFTNSSLNSGVYFCFGIFFNFASPSNSTGCHTLSLGKRNSGGSSNRSERRLCEEVHLNLAYRWFCRLGIEEGVPDHSTFSKNRHGRFRESGAFRWVFDEVVRRCMTEGLVKGEGFAVDASLIAANASHQHSVQAGEHCDWKRPEIDTRAMREYLAALDDEALAEVIPRKVSLSDPQSR